MRHIVAMKGNGGEMAKDKDDGRKPKLSPRPTVNVSVGGHWKSGGRWPERRTNLGHPFLLFCVGICKIPFQFVAR